jgi:hypothetical protein
MARNASRSRGRGDSTLAECDSGLRLLRGEKLVSIDRQQVPGGDRGIQGDPEPLQIGLEGVIPLHHSSCASGISSPVSMNIPPLSA